MATSQEQSLRPLLPAGLIAACAGAAICLVFGWSQHEVLWQAYLFALLTWWMVGIGGLGLVALGNLTGGGWATVARPHYLATTRLVPLLSILFIPAAFGLEHIYSWADPSAHATETFSPSKARYLSAPYFLARSAGYLFLSLLIAWWLAAVSRLDRPPASTFAMRRAGALSLVLLVPTATFAAYDWGMSLEPHWYSSIYGGILAAGGVVAAHAIGFLTLARSSPTTVRSLIFTASHEDQDEERVTDLFGDLGNLLLAFVMVWAYFSFSQFFLIWSVNLPSEISWYVQRLSHGWQYVALAHVLICFVIPFLALLSRDVKRSPGRIVVVASLIIFGYALNMYWTIVPAFSAASAAEHLTYVGALVGLGGLCITLYGWHVGRIISRTRQ